MVLAGSTPQIGQDRGLKMLQASGIVLANIREEAISRWSPGSQTAQHGPVFQNEAPQQLGIVLPRSVADVHRAPAHGARGRVQGSGLVLTVKHVPIRQAYLADEERVVRHVDQMHRVTLRPTGVEIVARPGHGRYLVAVQILRRVTHTIEAGVPLLSSSANLAETDFSRARVYARAMR